MDLTHLLSSYIDTAATAIERNWGASKRYARDNCSYSITALRSIIPKALDSVPLYLSRRFFFKSLRYLTIYEVAQCAAPFADMICRTYRSHRRLSDNTVDGAIRKAARENPAHAQALLAMLPENQSRLAPVPSPARVNANDSGDEELEEEEADEMDGDEEEWS